MDYSLSYDEYLKNFRKTHHPQAQAMSKDQYEFNKAAAEKQAKMKAAEEAGTGNGAWAFQEGPSDKIIQEATGKENPTHDEAMAKIQETAEQRLTREQMGTQAKGNKGDDHINNPNEADTADLVKVQQALEKLSGQKDSYTPEEIEAAKNEAGITKNVPGSTSANNALTDSVSEAVTPKENDTPEEHNAKGKYNKSMMSIWDAYRNGDIDKETAGYFTIDAIATLAKNLGRSIGNVGAQFSGGTIDNGHDESKWGQRQNALLNEEIGKETESLGGAAGRQAESEILDNEAKRIRNAYTPAQLEQQIEMFKKDLEMADINLDMAHSRTDLINFIKKDPDYAKSPFKMGLVAYLTQAGAAGAANNASKTLGDAINWVLTLAK